MKSNYLSFKGLEALLEDLKHHYPQYINIETIGVSWEQRPLYAVTVCDPEKDPSQQPGLLIQGTIHAREWIGIELLSYFLQYVTSRLDFDPKIRELLQTTTLYVIPCVNPDGFEYSRKHYSFWRKNRRDNGDGTFGVDLNRNFPVFFRPSSDTASNTYGGPEPLSEPEAKALAQFVDAHPNIRIALDYHSQGNVFFPAHRGRHEAEVESTDLNTLCADMAKKIFQVTERRYGIHRGRPPSNMVHGSAREYYFSRGILSTVIEVGSRNIPDYLKVMRQSILEHIPALLEAWNTTRAHGSSAPPRPELFNPTRVSHDYVQVAWEYPSDRNVVFEIYRSEQHKFSADASTLITETKSNRFFDQPLKSNRLYFYQIRARDLQSGVRGPFAPQIKIRTRTSPGTRFTILTTEPGMAGSAFEHFEKATSDYYGKFSIFVGASKVHGRLLGGVVFDTGSLPTGASLEHAQFSIYPMNRVDATIEDFGEWRFSLIHLKSPNEIYSYDKLLNAEVLAKSAAIQSDEMTQGIWHQWEFEKSDLKALEKEATHGFLAVRIEGPEDIPAGETSQVIQFDIGDGPFGGGINFRPNLALAYQPSATKIIIQPYELKSVSPNEISHGSLMVGFDDSGSKQYGSLSFSLSEIPPQSEITKATLVLKNFSVLMEQHDLRFSVEAIGHKVARYQDFKGRDKQLIIGYEVSDEALLEENEHLFHFDADGLRYLRQLSEKDDTLELVVRATSPDSRGIPDTRINWGRSSKDVEIRLSCVPDKSLSESQLCSQLIAERTPTSTVVSWETDIANMLVQITRNRFHEPLVPTDGVHIYSGTGNVCEDLTSCPTLSTWYSIFLVDEFGHWKFLRSTQSLPDDSAEARTYQAPSDDQFEIFPAIQ